MLHSKTDELAMYFVIVRPPNHNPNVTDNLSYKRLSHNWQENYLQFNVNSQSSKFTTGILLGLQREYCFENGLEDKILKLPPKKQSFENFEAIFLRFVFILIDKWQFV